MSTLQLPVSDAIAQRFQALTVQQQTLLSQLIADCLTEPSNLSSVMDYIGFKATQRGLTPELLQRLLDEK